MSVENRAVSIAILAFPETTASIVYGLYDLFMSTGRDWGVIVDGTPGPALTEPFIVAAAPGAFEAANGVSITPHATFDDLPDVDIVIVPELAIPPGDPLEGKFDVQTNFLRERFARGATLASACSGAMLLAQAGLLDGHTATTHWAYCDILARRYPTVSVQKERALVVSGEGGRLVMAGGGTSWLDLALYLIARTVGVEAAMRVAKINVIDWHDIGQQPFAHLAQARQTDDAVVSRSQSWIADHFHEPSPVAAMVRLSGVPERSFKRRFQQATGMSPLEYVHTLRLEEAKQMLERGERPVEEIAFEVGYEDAGFFSRLFRRHVSLTPSQYRKRFGPFRRALENATPPSKSLVDKR